MADKGSAVGLSHRARFASRCFVPGRDLLLLRDVEAFAFTEARGFAPLREHNSKITMHRDAPGRRMADRLFSMT
jgi:hypothetical protein